MNEKTNTSHARDTRPGIVIRPTNPVITQAPNERNTPAPILPPEIPLPNISFPRERSHGILLISTHVRSDLLVLVFGMP
ncbi:MAG TPA: hypothetical protein DEB39_13625 [Planctomycetaceae bacterium]|nr:hypothetical protein [Planctomycetaceae bacterium]